MSLPGTEDRRRIYLMRHGHVDYFARHVVESGATHAVTLTVRGRSEAEAAGRAFSHIRFDRAVCSGLPRTKETAEAVLHLGFSVRELQGILHENALRLLPRLQS